MRETRNFLLPMLFLSLIILLSGCINECRNSLPDNFTLHLSLDGTSGGGTRLSNSYISFEGDKVVSANRTYFGAPGTGGTYYCEEELNTETNQWISTDKSNVDYTPCNSMLVYTTREEITQAIQLREILPLGACYHLDKCYELIKT